MYTSSATSIFRARHASRLSTVWLILPWRGDEDDREAAVGDVVDRRIGVGQRDEQAPGSFEQDRVVTFEQFTRILFHQRQVDLPVVDLGRQLR